MTDPATATATAEVLEGIRRFPLYLISHGSYGPHRTRNASHRHDMLRGSTGMQPPLTMQLTYPAAPELAIARWFNTGNNPTLADLRGEVDVIEAFQMLCPGCVSHEDVRRPSASNTPSASPCSGSTACLNTTAMTTVSLEAFLHEYRITFPVGVDAHDPGVTLPITMGRFQLRGTPSLVVIDRAGRLRLNAFGQIDDLAVGATLARLIDEPRPDHIA